MIIWVSDERVEWIAIKKPGGFLAPGANRLA